LIYINDTQTGMLLGIPRSARCVQRFDDSLNSAIHITYRISLRSSSMREPRDPLLKVVQLLGDTGSQSIRLNTWGLVMRLRTKGALAPSAVRRECAQGGLQRLDGDGIPLHGPFGPEQGSPSAARDTLMILPQVHLRKPCYDFYFL
jgi:hypothetical protein